MKRNAGFTLIELVIVIIVLGILAATAVPKFINLQDDARASVVKGAEAAIHSSANMIYAKSAIIGEENGSTGAVSAAGGTINTVFGYPSIDDIDNTVTLEGDFTFAASSTTETAVFGLTGSDCTLEYKAATSVANYTLNNTCDD